jgi:hypothetical protein
VVSKVSSASPRSSQPFTTLHTPAPFTISCLVIAPRCSRRQVPFLFGLYSPEANSGAHPRKFLLLILIHLYRSKSLSLFPSFRNLSSSLLAPLSLDIFCTSILPFGLADRFRLWSTYSNSSLNYLQEELQGSLWILLEIERHPLQQSSKSYHQLQSTYDVLQPPEEASHGQATKHPIRSSSCIRFAEGSDGNWPNQGQFCNTSAPSHLPESKQRLPGAT